MTGLQQMPDMGSRGRVSNWIWMLAGFGLQCIKKNLMKEKRRLESYTEKKRKNCFSLIRCLLSPFSYEYKIEVLLQ
jgi:hypothetical protein